MLLTYFTYLQILQISKIINVRNFVDTANMRITIMWISNNT